MRLGLMGGTFDPIHLGHLRAAEAARERLELASVWFVPARIPPHRRPPDATAEDRFAMAVLATADHPAFVASDIELRREGPSYTVDTLRAIHALMPEAQLVLIVGSDTFKEMGGWKDPAELFALCEVGLVERHGASFAGTAPGQRVSAISGSGLPVSASQVRGLLQEGRSVRYLVPPSVADYIEKRGLYR